MQYVIIIIIVIVVLFLIGRELLCWYYKINERIELQKETNDLLRKLIDQKNESFAFETKKYDHFAVESQKISIDQFDLKSIISNTIIIDNLEIAEIDFPVTMNWESAKKECESLGSGWHLPTKEELNILFENKQIIKGISNLRYWSSTEWDKGEYAYYDAYGQDFENGDQIKLMKNLNFSFRAVRTIK